MAAVLISRTAMTDDDGTSTTGTVFNNAWKTALYDQIDAMLATVFTSTTELKSTVVTSSLTAVGTIATGVWNAGAITSSGAIKGPNVAITTNQIEEWVTNATAGLSINYNGYNGGTTQFRDFRIYDGKNTLKMSLIGSTGVMTLVDLASGDLTSVSGVITSSSDERLKDLLGALDYGLAEVLALEPIRYRWNQQSGMDDGVDYGGFGAAQVERSMPLAVSYGKDGMRSLHDRVILGGVVNAIKTLNARLRTCEARMH